jgi:16S rRNA (cytidine1402-2'-O)-methyltransferase
VCRELTKRHEEVALGTIAELAERFGEPVRGEVTLVLGAAPPAEASGDEVVAAVTELVEAGVPRRQAAELVSRLSGASRNALYRNSL